MGGRIGRGYENFRFDGLGGMRDRRAGAVRSYLAQLPSAVTQRDGEKKFAIASAAPSRLR